MDLPLQDGGPLSCSAQFTLINLTHNVEEVGEVPSPRLCCCWGELQVHPSSSLTFAVLMGTRPLFPRWISQMHFHTTFPPFIPPCASVALSENQLFFASLMAFWASLRAVINSSLSDALLLPSHLLYTLFHFWSSGRMASAPSLNQSVCLLFSLPMVASAASQRADFREVHFCSMESVSFQSTFSFSPTIS